MPIESTYLNTRVELLDSSYDQERFAALRSLLALYNPTLGPITAAGLTRPGLLDFGMYTSWTRHSALATLMPDVALQQPAMASAALAGSGKGAGQGQPFLSGLGEAAERLAAALYFAANVDQLVYASHRELERAGQRALGPDELPLFAPEQYAMPEFGFVPFQAETPLRWIAGRDLISGEPVLAPAQLLLMYYKQHPNEGRIGYATSGGLGLHADRHASILHGLFEFIERDAVNVRWYCRLPPARVEIDLVEFLRAHANYQSTRLATPYIDSIRVYLNTLDIDAPVFTLVALDTSRRQHAFLGSGGAASMRERALAQALYELGQARAASNAQPANRGVRTRLAEMTGFMDAPIYYGTREHLPRLTWYTAGQQLVAWDRTPSLGQPDYEAVLGWLAERQLRPLVFDLNGADWTGLSVTKVLVPQLTQAGVPAYPYLGHPRYYELPQRLGLARGRLRFGQLNADPVPFS